MPEPKWYRELTPYQWRVLVCACLGWALDIMDGFLYAISIGFFLATGLYLWWTHRLLMFAARRHRWGRRGALFVYFLGALITVPTTFMLATELSHAVLAAPIMGFFASGVTAAFAIYFPELFPTAIRATAQGFCFNFARFFSAAGPLLAGMLTAAHGSFAPAIATIGSIYFVGLIILIFAR